ncbi:Nonribosomal Peptide Synthase (NRPS) [Zalerion maritima]|uniref:Nonribosomal Peptide Synthase (NRPS) n=1 Tax=Zalerion maritima TaxID=339359 RepID=A0AAD5RMG6_9PEZI|nr:Nonribosomal Peptide Synthase (NRPS) [Zalerion maritima]
MEETPDSTRGLSILNPSPRELPGPRFLHELVARDRTTVCPAIDYLDAAGIRISVTYAELHKESDRLAQRISNALEPHPSNGQPVVSLLIPQCPELYITQLAILKARAAFCPLNLDAPPERIRFILQDVQATVVVATPELAGRIPTKDADVTRTVLTISLPGSDLPENPAEDYSFFQSPTTAALKPSDLAYVLYTSGSTGTPKGVGVPHISATQSILAHDRHIPQFSRFLQFAAPTFDVSVFELFFPLYRGKTLVGCNRSDMVNDLPRILRVMEVDACELTPTVAGSWLRTRAAAPGLKLLLTIGEMLTGPVISEFGGDAETESILWAMYGPTEAAIHCSLQPSFPRDSVPGNIGIPLDTVSLFVVEPLRENSSRFEVLPVGRVGELAIGGHQLAREYINRPESTSQAFCETPYGIVYGTGDKAILREDGLLECLGRLADGQVKLRGQRIELGEIEQVALKAPSCHSAVACVVNGNTLVLFCAVDDENGAEEGILEVCRQWLPAFMVPGDVKIMSDLPRLPSGKVDRKLLHAQYLEAREQTPSHPEKFRDELHKLVYLVVQQVVGRSVPNTSPLAMSGIDSLTAVRLASELRSHQLTLSATEILSCRDILALHSRLISSNKKKLSASPDENPAPPLSDSISDFPELTRQEGNILRIVRCTLSQAAMLYGSMENRQFYTNWVKLQFPPSASEYSIMTWFRVLCKNNDILRSGFAQGTRGFSRIVWNALSLAQVAVVPHLEFDVVSANFDAWLLRPFQVQILPSPEGCQVLIHLHHALYDGWSFDSLVKDLSSLASDGTFVDRPSFDTVVEYYSTHPHTNRVALDFWTGYLVGYQVQSPPALRFTTPDTAFGVVTKTLSNSLPAVHQSLDHGVHPQAIFQAALSWVWAGILGTNDIVIGSVFSGRMLPVAGIESIIGPCLTTLPLRVRLGQSYSARDLIGAIHRCNRDMMQHATTGLGSIKSAVGIAPGTPLFEAMFVYQQSLDSASQGKNCVQELDRRDFVESKLLVEVEPAGERYTLRATFHQNFAEENVIQTALDQVDAFVSLMTEQPDTELKILGDHLNSQLTSKTNVIPQQPTLQHNLADSFQEAAQRYTNNVALSVLGDGDELQSLRFGELNSASNRLARQLRQYAGAGDAVVAIAMKKSIALYVAILGTIKAGYAYLPILPETPVERVQEILQNAGVRNCLVDDVSWHLEVGMDVSFFAYHEVANDPSTDGSNIDIPRNPLAPAYVIYTSGTTGTPKGVVVTHANVMSNLNTLSSLYPSRTRGSLLQSCSQAFDVSVFEIFWTWLNGMQLCAAPNDAFFSDIEGTINKMGVTHLSMTPTVASLVRKDQVPAVEFMVVAGEKLTASVLETWRDILFQGYGPCETTNICTVVPMKFVVNPQYIGKPLSNSSAFVMAPDTLTLVPKGALGELVFGGDQIAQGYLNAPDLTDKRFILHPDYGRLYRSGDLGRMLPDGGLIISGRLDGQIKLRGQRIELGEVDSASISHGTVKDSATILVTAGGSDQLATFYVRYGTYTSTDTKIKETISRRMKSVLAAYMVPSYLIPLASLPSTPAGKIDKSRLTWLFESFSAEELASYSISTVEQDDGADWTTTEITVAESIVAALGTEKTLSSKWTPLASIGLDSITAISVSRELSVRTGQKIPISTVLRNPCVGHLASALDKAADREASNAAESMSLDVFDRGFIAKLSAEVEAAGEKIERILPCTPLQEAMLTSSHFNSMLFTLGIRNSTMEELWNTMRARHPILRTCFAVTDSERYPIAQVVLKEPNFAFLRYSSGGKQSLRQCIDSHETSVLPPLDSLKPPLSLALIEHGNSWLLSFICHHALYDGVAIRKLLEEVELLAQGKDLLPAPCIDQCLKAILYLPPGTESFWTTHFSNFQATAFPRSQSSTSTVSALVTKSVQVLSATIPNSSDHVTAGLQHLSASLLSLCQSSWATTLAAFTRTGDVCFGNVISGRSISVNGIEELVFPCFNTIPIRVALGDGGMEQYMGLVRHFQSLNPTLLEYQFTPLRMIQVACGRGGRLFDTLLLLQQPKRGLDPHVWKLEQDEGIMDVPLVCEVIPCGEVVDVRLHYATSLLSHSAASVVIDMFILAFTTALQFPQSRVHVHPNLPPELSRRISELELENGLSNEVALSEETLVDDDWLPTELKIRSVLASFASCPQERIRRDTTIYQLGLDSISAVQVASSLKRQGFTVTATDVIENPTCFTLGLRLTSSALNTESNGPNQPVHEEVAMKTFAESLPKSIDAALVEHCPPCTPLQEGLLTSFFSSSGELYLNRISLRPRTATSAAELIQAWRSTAHRHPILRTGFLHVDHEQHNYAMAEYKPNALPVPVRRFVASSFELDNWFQHVRHRVLTELDQPPWEVAVVEDAGDEDRPPQAKELHITMHHALYDAYSLGLILRDVFQLPVAKPAQSVDIGPALADLHHRYQQTDEVMEFWSGLSDKAVVNKFPVLTPLLQPMSSTEVITHSIPCFKSLRDAASRANTTIQVAMQSAWARLLASYHGESSVIFGVVLSGRTTEMTALAAFPCVNTLPVITSNNTQNRGLLDNMMDYNNSLHRHQYSKLSQIQTWLGLPGRPLFDTIVAYQNMSTVEEMSEVEVTNEYAKVEYPLSLELIPSSDDILSLQLTFDSQVVPVEAARIILAQFEAIFVDLVKNPEGSEDDLHVTNSSIFSICPPETVELPSEGYDISFLHEFAESSAQKHPDIVALEFVTSLSPVVMETWTYKQLDEMGNRVANLVANVVPCGEIVAICFAKCPEAYFSILGILKAGCSFVALDPEAPAKRKEYIVGDSGACLVLCKDARDLGFTSPTPVQSVSYTMLSGLPATKPALSRPLTAQDRSYCLYTSGTTGAPKGCELTHNNAVQAIHAFRHLFSSRTDQSSKCLQFASLHFDVSLLEQYWTWSCSLVLAAAPKELVMDDLVGFIHDLGITHIDLTPSLAQVLTPDMVPSLCRGIFITGGEPLRQIILDNWGDQGVIYNAYGPTEATIGVSMYPRVPRNGRSSNIGKQFPNVGSYILKPDTSVPVLKHGVGELCISGPLVGKGYLNRRELTEEKFPNLQHWEEKVYRTGDLVRVLHDGCFDFIGRADDQVKLRGQRLEIGEIDHVIKSVPKIRNVATIAAMAVGQDKHVLVSFIVSEIPLDESHEPLGMVKTSQTPPLVQDVLSACRRRLPGYMVPSYVLQLSGIPLSSNNKADVKTLKKLFSEIPTAKLLELSAAPVQSSPSSQVLDKILGVLRSLGIIDTNVGGETTIFDLGLDSISVLRLSRALKSAGLPAATPSVLLKVPVLADLAASLEEEQVEDESEVLEAKHRLKATFIMSEALVTKVLGVRRSDIDYIAPCSALQQGMISRSLDDGACPYFNTFKFELDSNVSIDKLEEAWRRVASASAILRTRFVAGPEGHVQVALKHSQLWKGVFSLPLEVDELPAVDDFLHGLHTTWTRRNKEHVMDPAQVRVLGIGQQLRIMVVNLFHGLYDGTSLELMLRHVAAEYWGQVPSYEPSFFDVLPFGPLRQRKASKKFWTAHLGDAKFSGIATPPNASSAGAVSLRGEINFRLIEDTSKRLAVAQQAVVQALWGGVLDSVVHSGITMGIVLSGRALEIEGAERAVGPLFNTIPFHLASTGTRRNRDTVIRKCHEFNTAVMPFQHTPLRDIQKWCNKGRAIFDTIFAFQKETRSPDGISQLWKEIEPSAQTAPDYPLAFEATAMLDGALRVLLLAQGEIFDRGNLEVLLSAFEEAVKSLSSEESETTAATCSRHDVNLRGLFRPPPPREPIIDVEELSDTPRKSFQWNRIATILRDEISFLANVPSENIAPSTSVLELGLDSVDTIRLSSRLKQKGVAISRGALLRGLTIKNIVAAIDLADLPNAGASGLDAIKPTPETNGSRLDIISDLLLDHLRSSNRDLSDIEKVLPPTPLQDAMVAEMVASNFERYFNHDVLALAPGIDIPRFERAWQAVINHTPILRTVFCELGPEIPSFGFAQAVLKPRAWNVCHHTVHHASETTGAIQVATENARASRGGGSLLQLAIVSVDDSKSTENRLLVLSIAHALYDGQSLDMLHQDVQAAYEGHYQPRPTYSHHLQRIVDAGEDGRAANFWGSYLSGLVPSLIRPAEGVAAMANTGVHRRESTSPFQASHLKSFCRRQGVTLQSFGQAVWATVLAVHLRCMDVVYGTVLSGRSDEAAESIMFPTMNTVPARIFVHGSVRELLQHVQKKSIEIGEYEHFPLRKIRNVASVEGEMFNSLFLMQRRTEATQRQGEGNKLVRSLESVAEVEYPACVEMEVEGDTLVWRVACRGEYFSENMTEAALKRINSAAEFFLQDPENSVVRFETGGLVSICGLESFNVAGSEPQPPQAGDNGYDDDSWEETATTIRDTLAEVSQVEPKDIKKEHSLYHLGLDSISAIKVATRLRNQGIPLSAGDLIAASSVGNMTRIAAMRRIHSQSQLQPAPSSVDGPSQDVALASAVATNVRELLRDVEINADQFDAVMPATPLQVHMLSAWQNSEGVLFFPTFTYEIRGRLVESGRVVNACKMLLSDVPILRSSLVATKDTRIPAIQVIRRQDEIHARQGHNSSLHEIFMAPHPKLPELMHIAIKEVGEEASDDNGARERYLVLAIKLHHSLYDAVSLQLLVSRIETHLAGGTFTTPLQCDAWSIFSSSHYESTTIAQRESFWKKYLVDYDSGKNTFPPLSSSQSSTATSRTKFFQQSSLGKEEVSKLKNLCAAAGVSVQALSFALFANVLSSLCTPRRPELVVGVYRANRSMAEFSSFPFPTLQLLPLRVRLGAETVTDLKQLVNVATQVQGDLDAMNDSANSTAGLWEINSWTSVKVDTFVNFLSLPSSSEDSVGKEVSKHDGGTLRVVAGQLSSSRRGGNDLTDDHPGQGDAKSQSSPDGSSHCQKPFHDDSGPSYLAPAIENNIVRNSYPEAVDIEVAIRDGHMDIGIFGPRSKVDESGARTLLRELAKLFQPGV